ncbi:MAG: hypothetical protein JXM69_15715 [Anaerolineae bacterium]|nr:hypothetical protein [Anaerolineae bacterium]
MDLPTILLILAAISMGATVIAGLVALRSAREARTAIFPIVKEEESSRARRARVSILVWIAITAILLGGWLASLQLASVENTPLDSTVESGQPAETGVVEFATQPLSEDQPGDVDVSPTKTALTSQSTPTPPRVTTPTPVPATSNPTPTAAPTPVPSSPTPTSPPRGPAPVNAQLGPIEFSTEIGSPIQAINPGTVFPGGVKIYAVYQYSGMQNGVTFSSIWYLNNVEVARDERPWEWGLQGRSFSFLLPPGEGQYKLELYVNDTLLTTGSFEVR